MRKSYKSIVSSQNSFIAKLLVLPVQGLKCVPLTFQNYMDQVVCGF